MPSNYLYKNISVCYNIIMKLSGCVSAVKKWSEGRSFAPLFSDTNPVAELLTPDDLSETWLPAESWQDLSGAEAAIPDYYSPRPSAIDWNELLFGGVREVLEAYRGGHRGKHRVEPKHSLTIRMELKQPFIPADTFIFREPHEGELTATAASVAEVALNTVGLRDVYVGQLQVPSIHQNQPQQTSSLS